MGFLDVIKEDVQGMKINDRAKPVGSSAYDYDAKKDSDELRNDLYEIHKQDYLDAGYSEEIADQEAKIDAQIDLVEQWATPSTLAKRDLETVIALQKQLSGNPLKPRDVSDKKTQGLLEDFAVSHNVDSSIIKRNETGAYEIVNQGGLSKLLEIQRERDEDQLGKLSFGSSYKEGEVYLDYNVNEYGEITRWTYKPTLYGKVKNTVLDATDRFVTQDLPEIKKTAIEGIYALGDSISELGKEAWEKIKESFKDNPTAGAGIINQDTIESLLTGNMTANALYSKNSGLGLMFGNQLGNAGAEIINYDGEIVVSPDILRNNGDKRVSLNIMPLDRNTYTNSNGVLTASTSFITQEEFNGRMRYILGPYSGFLYNVFSKTGGIVFPYTPNITMQHQVNYESTQIPHSNIAIQQYQNTALPSINIKAVFTADTPENAEYMLGVIWFLRALSKCEFGKESKTYLGDYYKETEESVAGLPPPILYLNGWGQLIDNTPVVISGFNIDLPDDIHYVKVNVGMTEQWLPTVITMQISLLIQPNLNKYKNQFSLDKYKAGVLGGMEGFSYDVDKGSGVKILLTNPDGTPKLNPDGTQASKNYYVLDNMPTESVKKFKVVTDKSLKAGYKVEMYNDEQQSRYNGSGWTW